MNVTANEVEDYVLNIVANDYESVSTIQSEACEWAIKEGKDLGAEEVTQALIRLVTDGMVDCFNFDAAQNLFVGTTLGDPPVIDGRWYMISTLGHRRIE